MKIITMPRAGGKTTAALLYMLGNEHAIYVSYSESGADAGYRLSEHLKLGLDRSRFVNAYRCPDALRGKTTHQTVLVVDNVELVLSRLLGAKVELATTTG